MRYSFSGLILIVIGSIALAHNLGYLNINYTKLLHTWWPVLVIAFGISFFFPSGGRGR